MNYHNEPLDIKSDCSMAISNRSGLSPSNKFVMLSPVSFLKSPHSRGKES